MGAWHPRLDLPVTPGAECTTPWDGVTEAPELPALFTTYLRFGAKVCGGPAIDRRVGTTDFFVMLDLNDLPPENLAMFFAA